MEFPWEALFTVIGIALVLLLVINAPMILVMLLTGIIRLIRTLFSKQDEDDL